MKKIKERKLVVILVLLVIIISILFYYINITTNHLVLCLQHISIEMKSVAFDVNGYLIALNSNDLSPEEVNEKISILLFLMSDLTGSFQTEAMKFKINQPLIASKNKEIDNNRSKFLNELIAIDRYLSLQKSINNHNNFQHSNEYKEIVAKFENLHLQTERLVEYLDSKNKYIIILGILNPNSYLKTIINDIFASIL